MFFSPRRVPTARARAGDQKLHGRAEDGPGGGACRGAALLLLLFGNGWLTRGPQPLPEGASSRDQSCPAGFGEGRPGFLLLTPSRLHLTRLC